MADKNHRVRTYGSRLWRLACAAKKTSTISKTDACRPQGNLSYMVHMYCDSDFDMFKQAAKAVLEHHFHNHESCGEWCPYLANNNDSNQTEVNKKKGRKRV